MTPDKSDYSLPRRLKDLEQQVAFIRRILVAVAVALLLLALNVLRITLR